MHTNKEKSIHKENITMMIHLRALFGEPEHSPFSISPANRDDLLKKNPL